MDDEVDYGNHVSLCAVLFSLISNISYFIDDFLPLHAPPTIDKYRIITVIKIL